MRTDLVARGREEQLVGGSILEQSEHFSEVRRCRARFPANRPNCQFCKENVMHNPL